ncbi:hypothetical protein HMPREF9145_2501 [Segatella salivae F0493]|uniref:Uncharacterized protein n=1 Tax=Segatella salivae F0493 TaxID=1395125 RepID=U2KT02_9BACT|nr:hypothetical protein HMPREF9145_2501 [Segatella salivae F0493]
MSFCCFRPYQFFCTDNRFLIKYDTTLVQSHTFMRALSDANVICGEYTLYGFSNDYLIIK